MLRMSLLIALFLASAAGIQAQAPTQEEEISRLERTIKHYEFRAERYRRESKRVLFIDTPSSLQMGRYARWLSARASEMREELDELKEKAREADKPDSVPNS